MRTRQEVFDADFLARLDRLRLIAKRLAGRDLPGAARSRQLGDGLEFADHRDYATGDDIRFVDWPYYARMEKLLVRLFHKHSESDIVILIDASASMAPGGTPEKFDYALHAAAALAYVAMGALQRVLVVPFAQELAPPFHTGRNRAQILDLLDYLAAVEPAGRTALAACAERLLAQHQPRGLVLLVSDLMDCGAELSDSLGRLTSQQCQAVVLHILAQADASPGIRGPMLLRHAETGRQMALEITPELLAAYHAQWAAFLRACEHTCVGRGATYIAAPTSEPFDRLVLRTIRHAGMGQ